MTRNVALIWLAGCAFIAVLALFDVVQLTQGATTVDALWRRDFTNVWGGGQLIALGDWMTLYSREAFTAHQTDLFGKFGPRAFSYPPPAFPIVQLFALPPYRIALVAWLILTSLFFIVAARRWWPMSAGWVWLAILTPAGLLNLWLGHFGFVFGGLWLLAFGQLDRRPILAGALIGAFATKPQLAVLIPLVLLVRRDWRAFGAAAASTAAVTLGSLAIYGRGAWDTFFSKAVGTQAGFIDAKGASFAKLSTSATTAILDMGGGWTFALAAQITLAGLGLALVVSATIRRVPTQPLALLTATATFLVLPYALAYDLTVVALGALTVMVDRSAQPHWRMLAAIGFVAPQLGIVLAYLGIPIMPLMLAGLAIAQYRSATCRVGPASAAAAR